MYVATINITDGVDGVEVYNMTKPQTGCLHDYQLMTDDMKTLEKADAFVINGAGMEDFMERESEAIGRVAGKAQKNGKKFLKKLSEAGKKFGNNVDKTLNKASDALSDRQISKKKQ